MSRALEQLLILWLVIMHEASGGLLILTGGGTAGHVMPNLALAPVFRAAGYEIAYIGSRGIEQELSVKAGIRFLNVQSGKLRRYFSVENVIDVFRLLIGIFQSFILMLRLRPVCVFSKGGFVAVPVSVGAWLAGVPVVSHESDVSPGLANRIISRFARMNVYAFPETSRYLTSRKSRCVGIPVRPEIFSGERARGLRVCGWSPDGPDGALPVVLFMGGSQGAKFINDVVLEALPRLLQFCRVVHLTGRGKLESAKPGQISPELADRYRAFEFLNTELPDVLAASDLAFCRSGANSIFEMLAIRKPMILVPLEKGSRGDQILNAESFKKQGWADVVREDDLNATVLVTTIRNALRDLDAIKLRMNSGFDRESSAAAILEEVQSAIKGQG